MAGIRLMGFWAKTSPDGKTYHEGSLGGAQVRLFLNDYKKTDKDPDVVMYISPRPKDNNYAARPSQQSGQVTPRPQPRPTPKPQPRQPYKDHTATSEGPPDDGAPWPDSDEMPF